VDAAVKECAVEADSVNNVDTDDNAEKDVALVAVATSDIDDNEDMVTDSVETGEFVLDVSSEKDISADDVTIALFVIPLTVAGIDTEDDNEGFEAVAAFVTDEEDDTDGLDDEVKESTDGVSAADIDDAIVFEDVCDPISTVEESIGVELTEFVFIAVAIDEAVFKLDTDGSAVPEVEIVFNPDTVGILVPLVVAEIVEVIEGINEEEALIVTVSKTVDV